MDSLVSARAASRGSQTVSESRDGSSTSDTWEARLSRGTAELDALLAEGKEEQALALVKRLAGRTGEFSESDEPRGSNEAVDGTGPQDADGKVLRAFGAARQGPRRSYSLEESTLHYIDPARMLAPRDTTLASHFFLRPCSHASWREPVADTQPTPSAPPHPPFPLPAPPPSYDQVPRRSYTIEELKLHYIDPARMLAPRDTTLAGVRQGGQLALLAGLIATWWGEHLDQWQLLGLVIGLLFIGTVDQHEAGQLLISYLVGIPHPSPTPQHEAGRFLISYLVGIPPCKFPLSDVICPSLHPSPTRHSTRAFLRLLPSVLFSPPRSHLSPSHPSQHEAGHFLVSYLVGIPPRSFTLSSLDAYQRYGALNVQAGTTFLDLDFQKQTRTRQIKSDMLDAVSCVALAGVCAEYLQFGVAEGGISDIQQFARSRATDRAVPAAPRSDPIRSAPFSASGSDGAEGGDAWARGFFPPRVVQVLDVLAQESGADRRGLVVDQWRKDGGKDGGGDGGKGGGKDGGSGRVAERLERLGLTLTGRDVSTVLRESADWRMTVAFFDWARKQSFRPSTYVYNLVLAAMGKGRLCSLAAHGIVSSSPFPSLSSSPRPLAPAPLSTPAFSDLFRPSTYVYNLVLAALGKGRQWGRMKELLTEMTQKGVELDNVTYSTIISSATRADQHDLVLQWLEQMAESECMPDQVSYATVMHALGRAGRPGDAVRLFERMRATGWRPDAVTYATIITAFGEAGGPQEAYDLWKEMKRVDEGMGQAEIVFRTMQQDAHVPVTTEAVTIMMALYTEKGEVEKALALAEEMREVYLAGEGAYNEDGSRGYNEDGTAAGSGRGARDGPFRPDATFYSVVLQACRECGLVEEARRAYASMKRDGVVLTENSVRQLAGLFAEKGGRGGERGEAGNAGSAVAASAVAGSAVAGLAGMDPAVAEVEALLADARAAGIYLGGRSSIGDRIRGSGSEEYLGLGVDLSGLSAVPTKAPTIPATQGMVAARKLLLDCLKVVDSRIHELVVVGLGEALENEVGDEEEGRGAAVAAAAAAAAAEGMQSAAKSPATEQTADPITPFTTLLDRTVAGVHRRDQKPLCNNLLSLLFLFNRRELSVSVLKAMVSTRQIARLFSRDWPHWTLHLSGLSYHGAQVALRYWLELVAGAVEAGKRLPREMEIEVGVGRSRKRHLRGAVVPELARLGSPFQSDEDRPRLLVAKGAEVAAWVKKTPELWSGRDGGGVGSGSGDRGEKRVVRGRWERSEGEGLKNASLGVDGKESDSKGVDSNEAEGRVSADLTAAEAVAVVGSLKNEKEGVGSVDDEGKKELESGLATSSAAAAAPPGTIAAGAAVGSTADSIHADGTVHPSGSAGSGGSDTTPNAAGKSGSAGEEENAEPIGEVLEKDGFRAYQIAGGVWVKECVCGERSSSRKQRCQNKACGRHLPTMAQFREI
ncbi:unnamed protein product [Closterium sp. NIES-64]|nr:unnamed protein product [Closterium sp. NIES-64]